MKLGLLASLERSVENVPANFRCGRARLTREFRFQYWSRRPGTRAPIDTGCSDPLQSMLAASLLRESVERHERGGRSGYSTANAGRFSRHEIALYKDTRRRPSLLSERRRAARRDFCCCEPVSLISAIAGTLSI